VRIGGEGQTNGEYDHDGVGAPDSCDRSASL